MLQDYKSGSSNSRNAYHLINNGNDVPPPVPPPPPPSTSDSQSGTSSYKFKQPQSSTVQWPPPAQSTNSRSRQPLTTTTTTTTTGKATSPKEGFFNIDQFLQSQRNYSAAKDPGVGSAARAGALLPSGGDAMQQTILPLSSKSRMSCSNSNSSNMISNHTNNIADSTSYYNNTNNNNIVACKSLGSNNNYRVGNPLSSPRKSSSNSNDMSEYHHSHSRSGYGTSSSGHKADIKMGTGGMMKVYSSKLSPSQATITSLPSSNNGHHLGPPKPPRILDPSEGNNISIPSKIKTTVSSSAGNSSNVDAIIHKMEALTYTSQTSNSDNVGTTSRKEKIYDKISKIRGSVQNSHSNYLNDNNKKGSSSSMNNNGNSNTLPSNSLLSKLMNSNSNNASTSKGNIVGSNSASNGSPALMSISPPPPSRISSGSSLVATLNGYSLQRSQTHSHITTTAHHSLERDSRADGGGVGGRRLSAQDNPTAFSKTR